MTNQTVLKYILGRFLDSNNIEKATPKRKDIENIENERSPKQATQPMKKGIPLLIDQASYKVIDIFKYNNDLSNQGNNVS